MNEKRLKVLDNATAIITIIMFFGAGAMLVFFDSVPNTIGLLFVGFITRVIFWVTKK